MNRTHVGQDRFGLGRALRGVRHLLVHSSLLLLSIPALAQRNLAQERLRASVTDPNRALLLSILGCLLIYVECNLPGTVVAGALGTLLLLLGLFGVMALAGEPASPSGIAPTTVAAAAGFAAVSFLLGWTALRARRNKALVGPEAMLGRLAVAMTALSPGGQVEVRGEIWQAVLRDPATPLPAGATVLVRALDGLTLVVERA